jgi:hypothetical protein
MTRLSANFTLPEFLRSEAAARHGIAMDPPREVVLNLERLANEVLEPIREAVGGPLIITSGYRPAELNTLVGGAANSDHLYGRAADFHAVEMDLDELGEIVRRVCDSLPVAKAIREFGQWVHVSIEPLGVLPRRKYLVASRQAGKTIYTEWA